jgi:hypothetical protein
MGWGRNIAFYLGKQQSQIRHLYASTALRKFVKLIQSIIPVFSMTLKSHFQDFRGLNRFSMALQDLEIWGENFRDSKGLTRRRENPDSPIWMNFFVLFIQIRATSRKRWPWNSLNFKVNYKVVRLKSTNSVDISNIVMMYCIGAIVL